MKSLIVEEHQLNSSFRQLPIYVKYYQRGFPKFHLILVHGAVEHSGRHSDLIQYFLSQYQDIAITTYDNIGHGKSGGARCFVPEFNHYVKDFQAVTQFVQSKNNQDTKNFIFAHSLGGLISLTWNLDTAYSQDLPISGMIFSSPCIRPKVILGDISVRLLSKLDKLSPNLRLPLIYKGAQLTRDSLRANDFNVDSLIPKYLTVGMASEIMKASDKIRNFSYYLNIPSLFLVSGSDFIVDPESTKLFVQGTNRDFVTMVEYPEHYHELWNEIDRKDIFKKMNKWLNQYLRE